jgi:hypothetical protein
MLTAGAAVLAVALATIGRNTAFSLAAVFAWFAVVEGIARGLEPSLRPWLWAESLATVFTWARLDDEQVNRSPAGALATMCVYLGVVVAAGAVTFRRRDLAAAT